MKRIQELEQKSIKTYNWNYDNDSIFEFTQNDWNQTLITRINEASKNVHNEDLGLYPLALICSSEGLAIMDDLAYFFIEPKEVESFDGQTEMVGFISSTGNKDDARYIVHRNKMLPANKLIIAKQEDLIIDNLEENCVTSMINITGLPVIQ